MKDRKQNLNFPSVLYFEQKIWGEKLQKKTVKR